MEQTQAIVKVRYTGPKKVMTVDFPVPFISKSEHVGRIEFVRDANTKESIAEMPVEWANQLLALPDNALFERVASSASGAPVQAAASTHDDDEAKKQAARDRMAKAREAKKDKSRENGGAPK